MNRTVLKWVIIGVVVVAAIVSFFVVRTLNRHGQFTSLERVFTGESCFALEAVPGPEDIAIDRKRGVAFVSAFDRRAVAAGAEGSDGIRGGIYLIDLTVPDDQLALRPVTPIAPDKFRPHGISLYEGPNGKRTLMAVNHGEPGIHTIEIFDVDADNLLTHRRTVSDPLIVSPNDVAAVTADTFYATNDFDNPFYEGTFSRVVFMPEDVTITFHDGVDTQVAADGFVSANGIALSPDRKTVYVADLMSRYLKIFSRDPETDVLTLRDQVYLGTGLDNIDVAADGSLWIAAHPKLFDFVAHMNDPAEKSPSQIVRVAPNPGGGGEARTVYLDDGTEISGSSVGATYKDRLLIGDVYDPKILVCHMGNGAAAE